MSLLCLFTFRWLSNGFYYTKCHVLDLCLEWICKNHKRSNIFYYTFFKKGICLFNSKSNFTAFVELYSQSSKSYNCVQDFIHGERNIYSNIYVEINNHFIKGKRLTKYILRFLRLFNGARRWICGHSVKHNIEHNLSPQRNNWQSFVTVGFYRRWEF